MRPTTPETFCPRLSVLTWLAVWPFGEPLHLAINVGGGDKVEPDYAALLEVNDQLGMAQKKKKTTLAVIKKYTNILIYSILYSSIPYSSTIHRNSNL